MWKFWQQEEENKYFPLFLQSKFPLSLTGSLYVISTVAQSQTICGRVWKKSLTGRNRWIGSWKERGYLIFYFVEQKGLKCVLVIWKESQRGENEEEKKKKMRGEEKRRKGKGEGEERKQHRWKRIQCEFRMHLERLQSLQPETVISQPQLLPDLPLIKARKYSYIFLEIYLFI